MAVSLELCFVHRAEGLRIVSASEVQSKATNNLDAQGVSWRMARADLLSSLELAQPLGGKVPSRTYPRGEKSRSIIPRRAIPISATPAVPRAMIALSRPWR